MSTHMVSAETLKQDGTVTGSRRVLADENGITVSSPGHHWQDTAALHEYTIVTVPVDANSVDKGIFTPVRGTWVLAGCSYTNRVVGSDGSAVTADIMACDGAEAPASGVTQLGTANGINLKSTVDVATPVPLATTAEEVGPGKYFGLNVGGTLTAVVSQITCEFKRVR